MELGFPEIVVILVVALLVLGPDKLPAAARKVGQALHDLKNVQETIKREVDQAMRDASTPSHADGPVIEDPAPLPPAVPAAEAYLNDHEAPPPDATPDAAEPVAAEDRSGAAPAAREEPA